MAKKKPISKYADLLEYCASIDDHRYKNTFFVHDNTRSIISTDGKRMLARRDVYGEVKVITRLSESTTGILSYTDKGLLEPSTSSHIPNFSDIIPTNTQLINDYKRISLTIPQWLESLHKKENTALVSIVLGGVPTISLYDGYEDSAVINLQFMKPFAGHKIDILVPKNGKMPFVFLESGKELEVANWFSLIMPLKNGNNGKPTYLY